MAVGGRSNEAETAKAASSLIDEDVIKWGYSDEVWEEYEVFSQPTVMLISSDDVLLGQWFGEQAESTIRDALDQLVVIG